VQNLNSEHPKSPLSKICSCLLEFCRKFVVFVKKLQLRLLFEHTTLLSCDLFRLPYTDLAWPSSIPWQKA